MNKDKLRQIFSDDPEILSILDGKQESNYMDRIIQILELVRGKDGYSPVAGKDYYTAEEAASIKREILSAATPDDGRLLGLIAPLIPEPIPGEPGLPGKDADEGKIARRILDSIPIPADGKDGSPDSPQQIADKLNTLEAAIEAKAIKDLPDFGSYEKRIGSIEKSNALNPKGKIDQRWHGAGKSIKLQTNGTDNGNQSILDLVAGTNMSITDDGTGSVTFDASGGLASVTTDATLIGDGTAGSPLGLHLSNANTWHTTTTFTPEDSAHTAVIIRGAASQSVNSFEFYNANNANPVVFIDPSGDLSIQDTGLNIGGYYRNAGGTVSVFDQFQLQWSSGSTFESPYDLGITRASGGGLEINNGMAGQYQQMFVGAITAGGSIVPTSTASYNLGALGNTWNEMNSQTVNAYQFNDLSDLQHFTLGGGMTMFVSLDMNASNITGASAIGTSGLCADSFNLSSSFTFASGASNGYVLTSDPGGTGTWQPVPVDSFSAILSISGNAGGNYISNVNDISACTVHTLGSGTSITAACDMSVGNNLIVQGQTGFTGTFDIATPNTKIYFAGGMAYNVA